MLDAIQRKGNRAEKELYRFINKHTEYYAFRCRLPGSQGANAVPDLVAIPRVAGKPVLALEVKAFGPFPLRLPSQQFENLRYLEEFPNLKSYLAIRKDRGFGWLEPIGSQSWAFVDFKQLIGKANTTKFFEQDLEKLNPIRFKKLLGGDFDPYGYNRRYWND